MVTNGSDLTKDELHLVFGELDGSLLHLLSRWLLNSHVDKSLTILDDFAGGFDAGSESLKGGLQ